MDVEINEVQEIIKNLESVGELSIKEEKYLKVAKLCAQLAAENVWLKEAIPKLKNIDYQNENMDDVALAEDIGFNTAVMAMHRWVANTPATDRIVAVIKAEGAEACVRALVTSDDDDFSDAPNICAMVAYQLREGADKC